MRAKLRKIIIYKKEISVLGQTSGDWARLGTFVLRKGNSFRVTVSGKGAAGNIVADAILLVPVNAKSE
jgi:hypothetical protein